MPTNSRGPLDKIVEWGLPTHGAIGGELVPSTCYVKLAGLPAVLSGDAGLMDDAVLFGPDRSWHPGDRTKTIGADSHVYRGPAGGTWTIRVVLGDWTPGIMPASGAVTVPLTVYARDRFNPAASEFLLLSTSITVQNPYNMELIRWSAMTYPKPDGSAVMVSSFARQEDFVSTAPPGAGNDPRYWPDFIAAHEVTISGDGETLAAAVALHTAQTIPEYVAATYETINFGSHVTSFSAGHITLPGDPYWTFYGYSMYTYPPQNPFPLDHYSSLEAAKSAMEAWLMAEWYFEGWTSGWYTGGGYFYRDWRYGLQGHYIAISEVTPGIVYSTLEGTVGAYTESAQVSTQTSSFVLSVVYDAAGTAVVWEVEQEIAGACDPSVIPATFDAAGKIGGSSRQVHFAEKKPNGTQPKTALFTVTGEQRLTTTTRIKRNGATACEKAMEKRRRREDYYYWHKPGESFLDEIFALAAHVEIESRHIDGTLAWQQVTVLGSTTPPSTPETVDLPVLGKVRSFSGARTSNNTAGITGTSIPDDPRLFAAASPDGTASIGDDGSTYTNAPWVCWNPRTGEIATTEGASWS